MVTTGDALLNGFRYTAAAPIQLSSGQTYVIGAWTSTNEAFLSTFFGNPSLASYSTSAEVTYVNNRLAYGAGTLVRPDDSALGQTGRFGPNFQYTVTAAVPDQAATFPLLGLAALVLASIRRTAGRAGRQTVVASVRR
ncbi:MAG: hypothetical protein NTV51_22365 [Verrucomicrobia bacterium]|nr:hypothetical protein [Verrucomicrobiota bacterium]